MKLLFVMFRGLALFIRYFKKNILSVIALSALFVALHMLFAVSGGISQFSDNVVRFDTIRAYISKDPKTVAGEISTIDGVKSVKIFTPADTKAFLMKNAPSVGGVSSLSDELFPTFIEITVAEDYQNVNTLRELSVVISDIRNVDTVSYGGDWAERVYRGKSALNSLMFVLVVLFAVVGVVTVYQTIYITLYRYSDEIRVYSIVGGTAEFITFPFAVLSALIGIACVFFSYIAYFFLHISALKPLELFLGFELSLSLGYCLFFFMVALPTAKISGLASAWFFLKRFNANAD